MKHILIAISLSAVLFGCKKQDEIVPNAPSVPNGTEAGEKYKTYTIKKDKHSSTTGIKKFNSDALKFKAIFDESAIYDAKIESNKHDIHKLYGFSDCGTSHQKNSARFGWRWYNGNLEIHAYTYGNEKRQNPVFIKSISLNQPHDFLIRVAHDKYIFTVDEKSVEVPRACTGSASGYYLYPYFGGDETAPHQVNIKIFEESFKE